MEELTEKGIKCFILDKRGKSIREVEIPYDCAFILGDHEGLPKREMKRLKDTQNYMFYVMNVASQIQNFQKIMES